VALLDPYPNPYIGNADFELTLQINLIPSLQKDFFSYVRLRRYLRFMTYYQHNVYIFLVKIQLLVTAKSEQDSDPHWFSSLDPNQHWGKKLDPDPH
jgi:hypothetical protein